MSDEIQLRKAVAMLRSFTDNLPPRGNIEDRYVNLYHSLLTDIESETGHDFDFCLIRDDDLKRRVVMTAFDDYGENPVHTYSNSRYCDRNMFLIKLHGALNYLRSFAPEPVRRIIGFSPE